MAQQHLFNPKSERSYSPYFYIRASLMAQQVKNLPAT